MIKFNFEVPIPHMEDFEPYQDIYFALNHLCGIPMYVDYIKQSGKQIILDNSYNELNTPDSAEEMIENCKSLDADYVVSPDSDTWKIDKMVEAYGKMLLEIPQEKVLAVIRSTQELEEFKRLGLQKYCVTYYHRKMLDPEVTKGAFHFLGLHNTEEFLLFSPYSCDTSMPIKLAMENLTLDEWIAQGCPHIHTRRYPDFFSTTLPDKILKSSIQNIIRLKEIINGSK